MTADVAYVSLVLHVLRCSAAIPAVPPGILAPGPALPPPPSVVRIDPGVQVGLDNRVYRELTFWYNVGDSSPLAKYTVSGSLGGGTVVQLQRITQR